MQEMSEKEASLVDDQSFTRSTRRTFLGYAGVLALGTGLAACSSPAKAKTSTAATNTKQYVFRLSTSMGTTSDSAHFGWISKFSQVISDSTNGRVTTKVYPSNQLGQEVDVVKQISAGAVDMMVTGSGTWETLVPELGLFDMGYLFDDYDHVGTVLDGPGGQAVVDLFNQNRAANAKILGPFFYSYGFRNVGCKTPIRTPAELKGKKLRVYSSPNVLATLKLMGVVPSPISTGEVYTALQTGVVDGFEHDAATILERKWYERAKYVSLTRHVFAPLMGVMSNKAWNSLPGDLQAAVTSAATEAAKYQRALAPSAEAAGFKALQSKGVEIITIDRTEFKADMQPLYDGFTGKYSALKPILAEILSSAASSSPATSS